MKKWERLRILMVTSELAPLAKAGGLGDMVAGLAKQLYADGHDARVMLPAYSRVRTGGHELTPSGAACLHFGGGEEQWVGCLSTQLDGLVPVELVEYARFFDRPGLYDDGVRDYPDNAYRFGLLAKAALQRCKDTGWIPDVVHVHDWQGGMLPAFLKTWDRVLSPLSRTASLLTIHNIGYQGVYAPDVMKFYGLGMEHFHAGAFEAHGAVNLLKAGVAYADGITTVSPTHARELLTPEGGCGLAPYLNDRVDRFTGILNGADYSQWDPSCDPHIATTYDAGTHPGMDGKTTCRTALAVEMGIDPDPARPLLAVVSRLVAQKGFDLVRAIIGPILDRHPFQLVLLGSGEPGLEDFFRSLADRYPGRVGVRIGFSEPLSHRIYAGSDFFVMPSLYEPCGLGQIYALRYGSIPLVRLTGGLRDTVEDGVTGLGFGPADPAALYQTLERAASLWQHRSEYQIMQAAGMSRRFDWTDSARRYVDAYRAAIDHRRAPTPAPGPDPHPPSRLSRNFMLPLSRPPAA